MANPRQRRKARSSSYKPVSHSRNAKRNLKKTPPIRGPKVLQEAWDKTKTVRQNYARLGLAVSLDPLAAGGSEQQLGTSSQVDQGGQSRPIGASDDPCPSTSNSVPSGFGRLVRDESGNVVGVEINDEEEEPMDQDVDHVEGNIDPLVREKWVINLAANASAIGDTDGGVIKELENISATATGSTTLALPVSDIGPRHTSAGELKYLQPLIRKHGEDIQAMAKDLRLNPDQRTAGQLRRALKNAGLLVSN